MSPCTLKTYLYTRIVFTKNFAANDYTTITVFGFVYTTIVLYAAFVFSLSRSSTSVSISAIYLFILALFIGSDVLCGILSSTALGKIVGKAQRLAFVGFPIHFELVAPLVFIETRRTYTPHISDERGVPREKTRQQARRNVSTIEKRSGRSSGRIFT